MNNPAAQTALGPMVIVAAEQYERSPLIHDPWAGRILPLGGRIAAALTRWSPVRRALIAVTEKQFRGGWASFSCRKRYIDDQLVGAVAKGVDAVVILGAGYDTRPYRLPELAGIPVCEVDLPAIVARKAAALRRCFGRVPPGVTLLPVDFETDDLAERFGTRGFRPGAAHVLRLGGRDPVPDRAGCAENDGLFVRRRPVAVWRLRMSVGIFWTGRRCMVPRPRTTCMS